VVGAGTSLFQKTDYATRRSCGRPARERTAAGFCQVLRDFVQERQRLTSEPNAIQRARMHPPDPWEFEPRVTAVFGPSGEFADWTGRLFFTVSGSAVSINFGPACPPTVYLHERLSDRLPPQHGLVSIYLLLARNNSAGRRQVLSAGCPDTCFSAPKSPRPVSDRRFQQLRLIRVSAADLDRELPGQLIGFARSILETGSNLAQIQEAHRAAIKEIEAETRKAFESKRKTASSKTPPQAEPAASVSAPMFKDGKPVFGRSVLRNQPVCLMHRQRRVQLGQSHSLANNPE
jgi:hypothetical protein